MINFSKTSLSANLSENEFVNTMRKSLDLIDTFSCGGGVDALIFSAFYAASRRPLLQPLTTILGEYLDPESETSVLKTSSELVEI